MTRCRVYTEVNFLGFIQGASSANGSSLLNRTELTAEQTQRGQEQCELLGYSSLGWEGCNWRRFCLHIPQQGAAWSNNLEGGVCAIHTVLTGLRPGAAVTAAFRCVSLPPGPQSPQLLVLHRTREKAKSEPVLCKLPPAPQRFRTVFCMAQCAELFPGQPGAVSLSADTPAVQEGERQLAGPTGSPSPSFCRPQGSLESWHWRRVGGGCSAGG